MLDIARFLFNFVLEYSDPKVRRENCWMPYQQKAASYLVNTCILRLNLLITWLWARQCGKTECVSIAVACITLLIYLLLIADSILIAGLPYGDDIDRMFPEGFRVGIFAPKGDSGARDFKRIQAILKRVTKNHNWTIIVSNTQEMTINCTGRDGVERQIFHMECLSAAPGSELESATFDLLLLEECQDLERDKILNEIEPMRQATLGTRIEIGTVGYVKCLFDADIDYNKAYAPEQHFEFDVEIPIRCNFQNGDYEAGFNRLVARYGRDSEFIQRKYYLRRNYAKGMLITESAFIMLHRSLEERWDAEPEELPDMVYLLAGLDVAKSHDPSIFKIGTADWRNVARDPEAPDRPNKLLRWQRSYGKNFGQDDYDAQFAEMLRDAERFPTLKRLGAICLDATGDRGDMTTKWENAGYTVIPMVFTGGTRDTEVDEDTGEIKKQGTLSSISIEYIDELETDRFGIAATEEYMGSLDWFRCCGFPLPKDYEIIQPSDEYRRHKLEATNCIKHWANKSRLHLMADPNDKNAHDDNIDADILFTYACHYHIPIDLSTIRAFGGRRTTAGMISESVRSMFSRQHRLFRT